MTDTEKRLWKEFITPSFQEEGACRITQGHLGKQERRLGSRRRVGKTWAEGLYCDF